VFRRSPVVFLVTSKISVVILGNFAVLCTLLAGRLAKTFFLGRLRDQVNSMRMHARTHVTKNVALEELFPFGDPVCGAAPLSGGLLRSL
jgi:hypothetical protein